MDGITVAGLVALLGIVCSVCSVLSFYFGRKKAIADDFEKRGSLLADMKYIKEALQKNTELTDKMSEKLEQMDTKREQDYRDLLVKFTELSTKYDGLSSRVGRLEGK